MLTLEKLVPMESYESYLDAIPANRFEAEFNDAKLLTVEGVARMAIVVKVGERRAVDLSFADSELLNVLRKIGHGQILPEVYVRFGFNRELFLKVSSFPLPDQKRVVDNDDIDVVVPDSDSKNSYTTRKMNPVYMSNDQVGQVFARDHIRTPEEQIPILEDKKNKPPVPKCKIPVGSIYVDTQRNGLVVKRTLITKEDALEALAKLNGYEPLEDDGDLGTLAVKIPKEEIQKVRESAAKKSVSMSEIVRMALHATGFGFGSNL